MQIGFNDEATELQKTILRVVMHHLCTYIHVLEIIYVGKFTNVRLFLDCDISAGYG